MKSITYIFTYVSLCFFLTPGLFAKTIARKWEGQLFSKTTGAILLKLNLKDYLEEYQEGPVQFEFKNLIDRKTYVVPFEKMSAFSEEPFQFFVLPASKYMLSKISFRSEDNSIMVWKPKREKGPIYRVKRQFVSALGEFQLSKGRKLRKTKGWSLKIRTRRVSFKSKKPWLLSVKANVSGVIDGKSSIQLMKLGGEKVEREASSAAIDDTDIYVSVSKNLLIEMYYSVELLKDKKLSKQFANALNANDAEMRECYQKLANSRPRSAGGITYTFLYSGKSQRIAKAQAKKISSGFETVAICLLDKLQSFQLPINKTLIGRINFSMRHHYE